MTTVGDRIKERRIELGLTQEDLALKLGYKSRSSINKFEKSRDLSLKMVMPFAQALNCEPTYLMGWEDLPEEDADIKAEAKGISELVKIYKQLTPDKQEQLLNIARTFK